MVTKIQKSLEWQLRHRYFGKEKREFAIKLLKKEGILNAKGELTAKGKRRNIMSHTERVKDRQVRFKKKHK